jgi:outer membrane immunogenic protein
MWQAQNASGGSTVDKCFGIMATAVGRFGTVHVLSRIEFDNSAKGDSMFTNTFAALALGIGLISATAFAQEDYTTYKSDVTVQALGSFVKQTTQNGIRQDATNSSGVLGTYRFWFDRHSGIEANYGWTRNTEIYNQNYGRVNTNSNELSAAYVFRMPMKRWSPFLLAGAGALIFDPRNYTGASTQTRAAFVYGGGVDVNLTNHLFLRGEYRGFVYNSPTYDMASLSGLDRVTHNAEPSIGFGWRF